MMRTFIFIPGYYGTSLIDRGSGHLVWGDPREVMFGKKTLARPVPGIRINGTLELEPHSLIEDVRLLGGLIKEDAYNKTINLLRKLGGEVEVVPWDWRQDPIHGVRRLHEKVMQIKAARPDNELILVSHSFGSLVSAYYLRYGFADYAQATENWQGLGHFSKVILSAAPFRGLMAIFRNMHHGLKLFLNRDSQSALAFSTFESSYYLLPPAGHDLIKDENLKTLSLGLHEPMNWAEYRWGLFHENHGMTASELEQAKAYVTFHLERAKKFHALIDAPVGTRPQTQCEILYLQGRGFKTLHQGLWLRRSSPNLFLYYPRDFKKWLPRLDPDMVHGDGDLTVPDFSLRLPRALSEIGAETIEDRLEHLQTLQHPRSQNRIHEFLLK